MDVDLDHIPVTDGILEAESAWAGGVADFGDREAGVIVQAMPGYFDYRGAIEDELRAQVGDEFPMYRAMMPEAFEAWRNGDNMGPVGFTFRESFARSWKNFAGMERVLGSRELVIVRAMIRPEWVVMRGKAEEDELVVNADEISFNTLGVL